MQKEKGVSTLILIITIIAVAVVAVGGVFAYQYFAPKTQPVVQTPQNQNAQTENQPGNNQQGPHINIVTPFVDSNGNTQFSVLGTGFIGSTPFVDGQGATYSASSFTDTSILLLSVKQLAISGTHTVYMKNSTTGQQSNIVTFKLATPTNQTAGWKTYTNDQAKFSVKYPSDWKYDGQVLDYAFGKVFTKDSYKYSCWIDFAAITTEDFNKDIEPQKDGYQKTETVNINGSTFYNLEDETQNNQYFWVRKLWVLSENNNFSFEISQRMQTLDQISRPYYDSDCMNVFNQIVSTFKFTK